jgi:hypothetical protein
VVLLPDEWSLKTLVRRLLGTCFPHEEKNSGRTGKCRKLMIKFIAGEGKQGKRKQ